MSGGQTSELTLQGVLSTLLTEKDLVGRLLGDLATYCQAAASYLQEQASPGTAWDRKKVHVHGSPYSHHEEISERLGFLKFIASLATDYCISKRELGVIYDLLVTKSRMSTD